VSTFRQDAISGQWVIIAPERGHRPLDRRGAINPDPPSHSAAGCPFCPGNESMLPTIIEETAAREPPGWLTRVVPNKYPALSADIPPPEAEAGGSGKPGYGIHEVIIETARHDGDLTTLAAPELDAVMRTYRHRFTVLAQRPGIKAALVFRNHGRRAGASLDHPHAQAIALGLVPPLFATIAHRAQAHYEHCGQCLMCACLEHELDQTRRIVEASERFVVLVPYAAARPFELWIVPRRHQASFAEAGDKELSELGQVLQRSLHCLEAAAGAPPYNFAIESLAADHSGAAFLHWRLRIGPETTRPGGFELGSGMSINPSSPEYDAEVLRTAIEAEAARLALQSGSAANIAGR